MDKPIILISVGKQNRAAVHNEQQAVNTGCNIDYVNAVVLAGGAPLMLPRITDAAAIRAAAGIAHGVIFTGGGDVVSLNYGEEPHPTSKWTDPSRDSMELALAAVTKELGLPVLGICRGIQILNVAAGGTLIQDIPSEVPEPFQHYTDGLDPILAHTVQVAEDSQIAGVLGATSTRVNSYHHQAVKEVGAGLRVTARALDGVAEAMEATDGRRLLAVQWHPEELAAENDQCRALFTWIVNEARRFQEQGAAVTEAADSVVAETEASTTVEGASAVARIANAIVSEAIRQSAAEIQIEPDKKGVRVCYSIDGQLRETMTVPKHIQRDLIDRFRQMGGLEVMDRSADQKGTIAVDQDGKSYRIAVQFQPGFDGERLYLRIE